MTKPSIRELIGLYDDLDNAIFFDGIGEFVRNNKYTDDDWKEKANLFLDGYQEVLKSNTTVAKHDYFLREKEYEVYAAYQSTDLSRTKRETTNTEIDLTTLMEDGPDEPFEGYFELQRKMSIPIEVLRKTLKENGELLTPDLPAPNKNIEKFGVFAFVLADERVVSVQYKGKALKIQPKNASTFLCVMRKCYGNTGAVSMGEIREFNKKAMDSENSIRKQVSTINRAVRDATGTSKEDRLIISANEIRPQMFRLNNDFLANI